jgi:hypothetical protein
MKYKTEQVQISKNDFDINISNRLQAINDSLKIKGKEYIRNDDPLHNFNQTAINNREHPAKSLHGMLSKHLTSYQDLLNDLINDKIVSREQIKEKFGDIINYFVIQEIIFEQYSYKMSRNDVYEDMIKQAESVSEAQESTLMKAVRHSKYL